ncbi:TetR family transcriptional regulator [Burkholderia ubonensis]|uniref:TetR/AcrR family transcriptional regulator n=1 Tax=Burkholderia ubonensis TaxID=101571 RepID=UPI0007523986|nr:TetR/AcrR family transcriptional regulator [Burkholderia ubonensis]KVP50734.1 TetR family transcriptional regulator [Burkholderia ubonensis]
MATRTATRKSEQTGSDDTASVPGRARLVPAQQRSRERFERILACAAEVMVEKGCDAFRMSDIVERTGIAFGSLYQYFPDKTAVIGTLAERYNALGHECVRRDLSRMKRVEDLHGTLCRITDSYYRMFADEPLMRDIWRATQADRALQALDEADGAFLAGLLTERLREIAPGARDAQLSAFSELTMVLIAAAVRYAIGLPPKAARQRLAMFKRTLPVDLAVLEA